MSSPSRTSLQEIALLFLKLGSTAFGGPAAHIAMMKEEVVDRRRWLTEAQFLDLLGATQLIPGPNSTELAIHIGRERRGWPGLLVAGACFILPAMLIVWALAWAYVRYGTLPTFGGFLYGVKPVIIAIVLGALLGLGRTALRSRKHGIVGLATLIAAASGMNELLILVLGGALSLSLERAQDMRARSFAGWTLGLPAAPSLLSAEVAMAAGSSAGLTQIFWIFLKIGAVLFGSGYVLLAFLRTHFVENLHWLTEAQLLDAVAVGQLTPGPVFTTATFIGYVLAGNAGATLATLGIFLPAFIFVAISAPFLPRVRKSRTASLVLDGVNLASLALLALVAWSLGRSALIDPLTIGLCLATGILLHRTRINSAWLVLGGGILGWLGTR